jgi:hypothetical protein
MTMPKAEVVLPDGTRVSIEGEEAQVRRLLEFYQPRQSKRAQPAARKDSQVANENPSPNLAEIVRLVKECPESDAIDARILDRTSQVDRILLPLYIAHEHLGNAFGLTSGEISKVTRELGVPVSLSNTSTALGGIAKAYVIGDKIKKRGVATRYTLSRKGLQYLREVLNGK